MIKAVQINMATRGGRTGREAGSLEKTLPRGESRRVGANCPAGERICSEAQTDQPPPP